MNADAPFVAVWSVLIVAMLALILLVGVIALLSFRATRPLGVGLLIFFFGGGFLLFVGLFFLRASAMPNQTASMTYPPQPPVNVHDSDGGFHLQVGPLPEVHGQTTTAVPSITPEAQAVPAQPAGNTAEVPAKQSTEATTNGDSHGEPAVGPEAAAAPAEAPAEPAPSTQAAPLMPPDETVPAEVAPAQVAPAQVTPASEPTSTTIVAEKLPSAPAVRPAWVDAPSRREQNVYQVSVKSGLFVTSGECQRALAKVMQRTVDAYIDEYIEEGAAHLVAVEPHFIAQRIRRGEFSETVEASVGPMQQVHGLLVFDDGVRSLFQQRWRQALVNERLWQVGAGSAVVLGLIGTLFGFLSWGQKPVSAPAMPSVVAEKSGAAAATSSRFWLHCAVVVAILVVVLAFWVRGAAGVWIPF